MTAILVGCLLAFLQTIAGFALVVLLLVAGFSVYDRVELWQQRRTELKRLDFEMRRAANRGAALMLEEHEREPWK